MEIWRSIAHGASSAWRTVVGLPGSIGRSTRGLWHFISQTASGADYILSHPFAAAVNSLSLLAGLLTGNMRAAQDAANRVIGLQNGSVGAATVQWVKGQLARLQAWVKGQVWLLNDKIKVAIITADAHAYAMVAADARRWHKAITRARAYAARLAKLTLQTVQRQAASAYDAQLHGRLDLITKVAEDLAGRQPELAGLVKDIATGAVDLLGVEDPLARIALGFALTHLIDRASIDRPIAALTGDLLGPLLGQPKPKDLHGVISDIAQRLGALEANWATFMHDGGPEILQAGKEWASITSILTDAGLLAFFGAMTVDPSRWAADVSAVAGTPVNDAIIAVSGLISRA